MATELLEIPGAIVADRPLRRGLRRFVRHRMALASAVVLVLVTLAAFVGPMIWRYGHEEITPENSVPPSAQHPLGTDSLGHDLLAQVMRGTQHSLLIAFTVAVLATGVGTLVGIVSGYRRGIVDSILMRLVDLVLTVPTIAVAAVLGHNLARVGSSWLLIALVLGALMWTSVARVVRSVVLEVREREFVTAARASGASTWQILRRHILPNVAGPVIVCVTILVAAAILTETALSFIGFGVRPPDTSLGLLVSNAQSAVTTRPWLFYFPGLVILIVALSINFVGDGIRDALDPTQALVGSRRAALTLARTDTTSEPEAALSIRALEIGFDTDEGTVASVHGIDLDLFPGEILGLVGESGSGKSVTANAVMGLLPRNARITGSAKLGSAELIDLSQREFQHLRGARIAMIFQDPLTSLSPVHTIGHQVAEAVRVHQGGSWSEARKRALDLLVEVGIPDAPRRFDDYPHQFSGGMRQRVVIAMAVANDPEVIIADEPTTALDVTVQAQVLGVLRSMARRHGTAVLLITHDLGVVAQTADRVAVMYAGRVVEVAATRALLSSPLMPYTRGLLDAVPSLDHPADDDLPTIPGAPPQAGQQGDGCAFASRCPVRRDECDHGVPPLLEWPVALSPGARVPRFQRRVRCLFPLEIPPAVDSHTESSIGPDADPTQAAPAATQLKESS